MKFWYLWWQNVISLSLGEIFLTGHMTGQPFNSVNWLVKPRSSKSFQYLSSPYHWPPSELWHESQYRAEKYFLSHELLVKWHPIAVAVARLHSFLSFGNFPKFCYIEPSHQLLYGHIKTPIRDIAYCFIENNIWPHHITYLVHCCWIDTLLWIAIQLRSLIG